MPKQHEAAATSERTTATYDLQVPMWSATCVGRSNDLTSLSYGQTTTCDRFGDASLAGISKRLTTNTGPLNPSETKQPYLARKPERPIASGAFSIAAVHSSKQGMTSCVPARYLSRKTPILGRCSLRSSARRRERDAHNRWQEMKGRQVIARKEKERENAQTRQRRGRRDTEATLRMSSSLKKATPGSTHSQDLKSLFPLAFL